MSEEKKETGLVRRGQGSTLANRFALVPSTYGEAMEMAAMIVRSEMCPKAYRGKAPEAIIAFDLGANLGFSWMQSLQTIAVIGGRPSVYGDGFAALIQSQPECEEFVEKEFGTFPNDDYGWECTIKRRGRSATVRRFTIEDAKRGHLWGKEGPWQTYPKRQCQMRARGFAGRDSFPDALMGLLIADEAMDYPDAIEAQAVHVTEGTAPDLMEKVPEGMRENVEKAFATLNFSAAQRFTKLNEFLGGADTVPEEGATALLEWCKDEYAKRKTGQPRSSSRQNSNAKRPTPAESQTAAELTHGEHQAGAPVVDAEVVEEKPSEAAASENNQRSNREGEWF